jgi:hypothetical protein
VEQLSGKTVELGPGMSQGVGIPVGQGSSGAHGTGIPAGHGSSCPTKSWGPAWPDGRGKQGAWIRCRAGALCSLRGGNPVGAWIGLSHAELGSSRALGVGGLGGGAPGRMGIWHGAGAQCSPRGREPSEAQQLCRPMGQGLSRLAVFFSWSWHVEAFHDLGV